MMKTNAQVMARITKIKNRYLRQYIKTHSEQKSLNCLYCERHAPRKLNYETEIEFEIAPRYSNSLVVIQPNSEGVHLCMYGSEDLNWNGDICDDRIAKGCSLFKPSRDELELQLEFNDLLSNDEYVYESYKDLAALQWVCDVRVHKLKRSFISSISLLCWFIWSDFQKFLNSFKLKNPKKLPIKGVTDKEFDKEFWGE